MFLFQRRSARARPPARGGSSSCEIAPMRRPVRQVSNSSVSHDPERPTLLFVAASDHQRGSSAASISHEPRISSGRLIRVPSQPLAPRNYSFCLCRASLTRGDSRGQPRETLRQTFEVCTCMFAAALCFSISPSSPREDIPQRGGEEEEEESRGRRRRRKRGV